MLPDPTARLRFRPMTEDDLDAMADLLGDPEVMRYYPAPKTRDEAAGWIAWNRRNQATYGHGLWIVETTDGEFVGDCGLTWQRVAGRPALEVGYHVRRALQGRGYATEAAAACRDLAVRESLSPELVAIVHPDNAASRRVAEKLGMTGRAPDGDRDVLGMRLQEGVAVRPVRADEWEAVRGLRLRALRDPVASLAFVDTVAEAEARPDRFWRDRAENASVAAGLEAGARQFVAVAPDGRWVGTATALVERAGGIDYEGATIERDGHAIVGVYVDPAVRGEGILGRLFAAADAWTGGPARLHVHVDNVRAVRAYEKLGFRAHGPVTDVGHGPQQEMRAR
jgi:RimJ/RimL family protein N-acetyltransferase